MRGRATAAVCAIGFVLLAATPVLAEAEIGYRVRIRGVWSAETHPQAYPSGAHFSPPVGAAHNAQAVFWEVGALASDGIESMAETGATSPLGAEILDEAAQGNAWPEVLEAAGFGATGARNVNFDTTRDFPRLTLVTMIAPSPDWFTGVSGFELFVNGRWRDDVFFELGAFDAGTDSGPFYTSLNDDTVPPEPISVIVTPPLAQDGVTPPVVTFTIFILDVDGLPPYEDADGDGLTNLREAELGTDLLLPDTDGDSWIDGEDNCPADPNPLQVDVDADGWGEPCDSCPATSNPSQYDVDADGEGDACDENDGLILFERSAADSLVWQDEPGIDAFHVYRGDVGVLTSGGDYTQDPGAVGLAERFCFLTGDTLSDGLTPPSGAAVFYLVTGETGGVEGSLGADSTGAERPNANPCD